MVDMFRTLNRSIHTEDRTRGAGMEWEWEWEWVCHSWVD